MVVAYELIGKGEEVALMFQGAGVRWASEVVKPDHPANALFNAVKDAVVGARGGRANVFGATEPGLLLHAAPPEAEFDKTVAALKALNPDTRVKAGVGY
jgi:sigma54-dependent transcription regulator